MRPYGAWTTAAAGALVASAALLAPAASGQSGPATQRVFMTGAEIKGSTTADRLAPPPVDPAGLSQGYAFKGPGAADTDHPQKWEVSSYIFTPGFVTVQRGDTVALTVFMVNGDAHEVHVTAPDGTLVVPHAIWNRGREYRVSFVAEQVGTYELQCSTHRPTMTATIRVLPR